MVFVQPQQSTRAVEWFIYIFGFDNAKIDLTIMRKFREETKIGLGKRIVCVVECGVNLKHELSICRARHVRDPIGLARAKQIGQAFHVNAKHLETSESVLGKQGLLDFAQLKLNLEKLDIAENILINLSCCQRHAIDYPKYELFYAHV